MTSPFRPRPTMDPADPASLVRSPSPLLSTPSMVTVDTFQTAEEAQSSSRRSSHETIQVPRILTPDTVSIASEASPLQPARALLPPHPRHLSSFTHTLTNIANMLIGIGILALPKALEMTGWVPGFLLMVSVCDATVYTANLLSRCMDAPISGEEGGRGKRAMTYSDVGRRAFGPAGETFVGLVVGLDLIVVSITYLILCLDSIGQLWPEVRGKVGLHVVVGVAVAPLTFLGNMRWLSYVGVFGGFESSADEEEKETFSDSAPTRKQDSCRSPSYWSLWSLWSPSACSINRLGTPSRLAPFSTLLQLTLSPTMFSETYHSLSESSWPRWLVTLFYQP